jgi:hypothetical protein
MAIIPMTFDATLESIRSDSADRGVPEAVVDAATQAVIRAFPQFCGRTLSLREGRRMRAYFVAVVRRRVIRDKAGRHVASRAVLKAVVADLQAVGCGAHRIADELERGWRGRVPDDVLDEVRLQFVS